jgi:hypothetical protein
LALVLEDAGGAASKGSNQRWKRARAEERGLNRNLPKEESKMPYQS